MSYCRFCCDFFCVGWLSTNVHLCGFSGRSFIQSVFLLFFPFYCVVKRSWNHTFLLWLFLGWLSTNVYLCGLVGVVLFYLFFSFFFLPYLQFFPTRSWSFKRVQKFCLMINSALLFVGSFNNASHPVLLFCSHIFRWARKITLKSLKPQF